MVVTLMYLPLALVVYCVVAYAMYLFVLGWGLTHDLGFKALYMAFYLSSFGCMMFSWGSLCFSMNSIRFLSIVSSFSFPVLAIE